MATGLLGADVEELRELAADVGSGADQLRALASRVEAGVQAADHWQGRDAERCKQEWAGIAQVNLASVADALASAQELLRRNADEQEQASGDGSTGSAPGWGQLSGLVDLWHTLNSAIKAKGVFDKAKLLAAFFSALRMPAEGFVALSRVEKLLETARAFISGTSSNPLMQLFKKASLGLTIPTGLWDAWTGGGYEGWRGWATRGFGLAGAAGAATLLIGGAALAVSAPVTATVAAVAVTAYAAWSAGNYIYDHRDAIGRTVTRVWEGAQTWGGRAADSIGGAVSGGVDRALGWARGLLGSPAPAGAGA